MSVNLPDLFTIQFSSNVELLLQEKGNKLRPHVASGSHVGKQASPINQVGAITVSEVSSRFAPKVRTDAPLARRWVFPTSFNVDQSVDTFDELRTIVDVKSAYAENATLGFGRKIDKLLINAATATSAIGEQGAGTEAFDTTNYRVAETFGASAAVGLTVAKLIEGKRILRKAQNDLDTDPLALVISATQESDLLNQVEIVSTEFNDRPVLVDGRLTQFLGFNIVMSEQLNSTDSDTLRVLAFVKSGMYLGVWSDMQSDVHRRYDLQGNPWELSSMATWGATRTQQGKVIDILCKDAYIPA